MHLEAKKLQVGAQRGFGGAKRGHKRVQKGMGDNDYAAGPLCNGGSGAAQSNLAS